MPSCDCCLGEDFDCIDGVYICTGCNTQSQGFQVEVYGGDILTKKSFLAPTLPNSGKGYGQVNTAMKEVMTKDFGRPWSTNEMFTCILREQVSALIELGASAQLKDVVLRVWALYLQTCRTAFVATIQSTVESSTDQQRQRDKYLGTVGQPGFKSIKRLVNMKKKNSLPIRYKQHLDLRDALSQEEFYEEDNPVDQNDSELMVMRLMEAEERKPEVRQSKKVNSKNKSSSRVADSDEEIEDEDDSKQARQWYRSDMQKIEIMNMSKTLAILFIALRYTNPEVMLHDIVRWVKDNSLPFNNAVKLSQEDMRLFDGDFQIFCHALIPTPSELLNLSNVMVSFLQLKSFPDVQLDNILSRFTVEMRLPYELHAVLRSFSLIEPPYLKQFVGGAYRPVDFSLWSMACIVIVLKIFFGLDGAREREISRLVKEMSDCYDFDPPLFIWSDWVSHMEAVLADREGCKFPSSLKETRNVTNLKECMDDFEKKHCNMRHGANARNYSECSRRLRDRIQGPLNALYERFNSPLEDPTTNEGSGDLTDDMYSSTQLLLSTQQTQSDRYQGLRSDYRDNQYETADTCSSRAANNTKNSHHWKSYQRASMLYILNPERFLSDAESRILCSTEAYQQSNESDVFVQSQDLFVSLGGKKRTFSAAFAEDCNVKSTVRSNPCMRSEDAVSLIRSCVEEIRSGISDRYEMAPHSLSTDDVKFRQYAESYEPPPRSQSESYYWLLEVCSSWVDSDVKLLEHYVQRLELLLFKDNNDIAVSQCTYRIRLAKTLRKFCTVR